MKASEASSRLNPNQYVTEAPYDRDAINKLEEVFGPQFVLEKHEALNKSLALKTGLQNASKSGKGTGYPDAVVFLDHACTTPFVLVEAKPPNKIQEAWGDLQHYASCLQKSSVQVPFGLAISGNQVELKKWNSKKNIHESIHIHDVGLGSTLTLELTNGVLDLREFKQHLKAVYLRDEKYIQINNEGFSQEEILDFCVQVNKKFHAMGIKESVRPTILTYFLVCCLDSEFSIQLDKLKTSPTVLLAYSREVFTKVTRKKKFTLNNNIFSILIPSLTEDRKELDNEIYSRAYLEIFNLIDLNIAGKFKGICKSRAEFIDRLLQAGNFLGDAYEVFHTYTSGNDQGQYFTPRHAVDLTIEIIEELRGKPIDSTDVIYDPACGVGGFLCLALKHALSKHVGPGREALLEKLGNQIYGAEIEQTVADMAKVNLLLRGDGKSGIVTGSSLDADWPGSVSPIKERLEADGAKPTLVLMNPPFPSKNSTFKSYDFVKHALDVAADGAWIGAVVPLSVVNGTRGNRSFRCDALKVATLRAVITLPPDLFSPKANANTAIIVLEKKIGGHRGEASVVFSVATKDGLKMHRGKKQRIPDFNTADEFQLLRHHWLPNRHSEVYEKYGYFNPMADPTRKDYFLKGGEWSAEFWLNNDPASSEESEIIRLTKLIMADYQHALNIRNLGGRW